MKKAAVEWLHYVSKQRELDKFDWEQAKELEKDRMIEFHKWMIENDTVQNAEKHFHFTDSDMLHEYYNETFKQD